MLIKHLTTWALVLAAETSGGACNAPGSRYRGAAAVSNGEEHGQAGLATGDLPATLE